MICPICKKGDTSVVDSRPTEDGTTIRRRRLCVCGQRFTTFERVQFRELTVIKKNGRKSSFDREKLSKSIYVALKKRPIDTETTEKFISKISRSLEELGQSEILSNTIGTKVPTSAETTITHNIDRAIVKLIDKFKLVISPKITITIPRAIPLIILNPISFKSLLSKLPFKLLLAKP